MMRWIPLVFSIAISASAFAQTVEVQANPITDADIRLLRQDLQSQKNQIITDTMTFTSTEAAAFWPIYKEYASEQQAIAAKRLDIIIDYAQSLEKMDDSKARDLSQRMFAIDDGSLALKKKYYPRFEKAIGPKRAAKFYQVDNRLNLLITVQLTSEIPLIP